VAVTAATATSVIGADVVLKFISATGDDVDVLKFTSVAAVVWVVTETLVIDGWIVVVVGLTVVVMSSTNVVGPTEETTRRKYTYHSLCRRVSRVLTANG